MLTINSRATIAIETVTPHAANELLLHQNYNDQRPKDLNHIRKMSIAMKRGTFGGRAFTMIVLAVIALGEKVTEILVDGQHRLESVVDSGKETTFIVQRVQCDTMADVDQLYNDVDKGKARGIKDLVRTHKIGQKYCVNGVALPDEYLIKIAGAIRLLTTGFNPASEKKGVTFGDDQMKQAFDNWAPYFMAYYEIKEQSHAKQLLQGVPLLAFALVALRYGDARHKQFLNDLAQGTGQHNQPSRVIFDALADKEFGTRASGISQASNPNVRVRIITSALNAQLDGAAYPFQSNDQSEFFLMKGTSVFIGQANMAYNLDADEFVPSVRF